MNRQKINRSLHASKGVKIDLSSSHGLPVSGEEGTSSFYEIDIFNCVNFCKNNEKSMDDALALTETASRALVIEKQESETEYRILKIPLIESYYPTLQQTKSNISGISFEKGKIDSKNQTDLNWNDIRQEEEKEKADKENQSLPEDFNELLKNIMIEYFPLEDDSSVKIMFENFYEKMNKKQLHLHRHEHHHHYYFDNSTLTDENASPLAFKNVYERSHKVRSGGRSKILRNRECQTGIEEKEEPAYVYYCKCPRKLNLISTKTSSDVALKPGSNSKACKTSKIKKERATLESSRLKLASSDESIPNKKSDFVMTRYSDTELRKLENRMLHMAVVTEFGKESLKELDKDDNCCRLVKSDLKNSGRFVSPNVAENQIRTPEVLRLRCECTSLESSVPNDRPLYNSAVKEESEEKTRLAENKSDDSERIEEELVDRNEEEEHDSEMCMKIKLKSTLREIKKEQKRIEGKHRHKKKNFISVLNNDQPIQRKESTHDVTVYSSKTFIVGTDGLYLAREWTRRSSTKR